MSSFNYLRCTDKKNNIVVNNPLIVLRNAMCSCTQTRSYLMPLAKILKKAEPEQGNERKLILFCWNVLQVEPLVLVEPIK